MHHQPAARDFYAQLITNLKQNFSQARKKTTKQLKMIKPLVSVDLLLYKPGLYLKPCLDSILNQSYKNFELLVIDNNSEDETVQDIRKIMAQAQSAGPAPFNWRLIENKENLGFAAGHNLGIRESRGELVFLLNQDIILEKDFLENSVEIFSSDEKIGSVQGKLLRLKVEDGELSKTKIIDNTGLVILKNRRIIARGQGQQDQGQFEKSEEIFGVDGAAPIYRRGALESIKICLNEKCEYLDEDFFMYKEDVDLAWRLRLQGWKAFYAPGAIQWHARSAGDSAATSYFEIVRERLKISKFAKYLAFKNQRLMQIKNEQAGLLLKHLFWFLPKEIASWVFVILFEHYTWRSIRDLFLQAPRAWQKRKIIMARKKVDVKDLEKWFK